MDAVVCFDVVVTERNENEFVGELVARLEGHIANVECQPCIDDRRIREVQHGLDRRLLAIETERASLDDETEIADAFII